VQATYLDKPHRFTPEQLMAMLLVDLKEIAETEGCPVTEAVLSVPVYYTEPERHAMLAAAQVGILGRLQWEAQEPDWQFKLAQRV
jgi:heat shock protein 4